MCAIMPNLCKLALSILSVLAILSNAHGECNVCAASTNLACVSQTQFQVCVNTFPSGPVNTCPTGHICSTATDVICLPNSPNVLKDCDECNQCDVTNTFACTGVRTFALCLGTTAISSITGSCAPYHVCNIGYPQICGNATMGITATCPSTVETTTTVAPTTAPTTVPPNQPNNVGAIICQSIKRNGKYPIGNDLYTTCRQYVYCFINNGVWSGQIYSCPGSTYFDDATAYCVTYIPARCGQSVQSLTIGNILLE